MAKEPKMTKVAVTCTGVSPFLMNPMTKEILMSLPGSGVSPGAKRMQVDLDPFEMAKSKVLTNDKGEKGIPVDYLYSCLANAGREVTFEKKKKISTAESTLLYSFLTIEGEFIPFLDQAINHEMDIRRVVNRTTKGAMAAVRPKFMRWAFRVIIEVNTDEIGLDKVRQLFVRAGMTQGMGDFRPNKRGRFGQFKVTGWEVASLPLAEAA